MKTQIQTKSIKSSKSNGSIKRWILDKTFIERSMNIESEQNAKHIQRIPENQ